MEDLYLLIPIGLIILFICAIYKLNKDYKKSETYQTEQANKEAYFKFKNEIETDENSPINIDTNLYIYMELKSANNKLDRNHNLMIIILFVIIILSSLILYCIYKWTYVINPNTLHNILNNIFK